MLILKQYIPATVKIFLKNFIRNTKDIFNGDATKMQLKNVKFKKDEFHFYKILSINQPLKINESNLNKLHNLSVAINKIKCFTIEPNQIFSFWKMIGNPSTQNNFLKSRTIINGKIEHAVGGGLCQLSGLLYYLALQAGLQITERHAHSVDIYTDEERFTPLGSDATVAYGYKDLRFCNPFNFSLKITITLTDTELQATLFATEHIKPITIEFICKQQNAFVQVTTKAIKENTSQIINVNDYALLTKN
jgi:vancomycin resistance protein VanW